MYFINNLSKERISATRAIIKGKSSDGGFFLPESLPTLSAKDFNNLQKLGFRERFAYITHLFFEEFSREEILEALERVCPEDACSLLEIDENLYFLELWREGESYDDLCLSFFRAIYDLCVKKEGVRGKSLLCASSPEQALSLAKSFAGSEHSVIPALYYGEHSQRIGEALKEIEDSNILSLEVKGEPNKIHKVIDSVMQDAKGFGDIDSVFYVNENWGSVLPLICCFISAYCDLLEEKGRRLKSFNVAFSEGDYRCLVASLYAKKMGVPIYSTVVGTKLDEPLTELLCSGLYKKEKDTLLDYSESLWQFLAFELCDRDYELANGLYKDFRESGFFRLDIPFYKQGLFAESCPAEDIEYCISALTDEYGYCADVSLALTYSVYNDYYAEAEDERDVVMLSLSDPFMFEEDIEEREPDNEQVLTSSDTFKGRKSLLVSVDELKENILLLLEDALR